MIASSAEKAKVQNTVLGNTDEITCDSVAKINNLDYASCSITFEDNTAKVTIEGKGKFKGLNVCGGTKTSASATNESCGLICEYGIKKVANAVKPYEVKDYDSCVNYLTNKYTALGVSQEFIDSVIPSICNGNGFDGYSTSDIFIGDIEEEGVYTEKELVENNVIKGTIEEVCNEPTPEDCFAFDSENGAITGYDVSCGTDVVIPSKINNVTVTTIGEGAFTTAGEEVTRLSLNKDYTVSNLENNTKVIKVIPVIMAVSDLGITSVVFPNTLRIIGDRAFRDNPITGELDLTNTKVETIGENAFSESKITSVKLPNTIVSIGNSAFNIWNYEDESNYLTNIYLGNVNAELGNCAFGVVDSIEHNLPDSYSCVG